MKKYINTRQLAFLIFILIAIFLIRFFRGEPENNNKSQGNIESSLQKDFRQKPIVLSELAACQAACINVPDSSLSIILRYGSLSGQGDTQTVKGRSMIGEMHHFQFVKKEDQNLVIRFTDVPDSCDCSQ